MKKFYITTPIYYINAKPHIGHAYTTVAADMFARYWRMRLGAGAVHFLTGTDEHGGKIAQKAEEQGVEPKALADEISAQYQMAWDRLSISNNDFIRTTEERHKDVVMSFIKTFKEAKTPLGNEVLFEGEYEGLYCVQCERYYAEDELNEQGLCPDHKVKPELVKEQNWFFRLSDYTESLKKAINTGVYEIAPEARKKEVLGLLEQGLKDLAFTRQAVEWGIQVPWDTKQTIYVWVDALINYVSALGGPEGEKYKEFWPADIQLMSKDILKFHAVIWPAMLTALGLPLPKMIFAHGFFTIDGQKMSKTLGNVIDPNELVDKYGADATRFLLVSQFGFGTDGDIAADRFDDQYNAHLAGGIGNLLARVTAMTNKYFPDGLPEVKVNDVLKTSEFWREYHERFDGYQLYEAIQSVWRLIDAANKYIEDQKPWELAKSDETRLAEVLYTLLESIRHISLMIVPIMPDIADKIMQSLGLDPKSEREKSLESLSTWGELPFGVNVVKGESIFPRIEA